MARREEMEAEGITADYFPESQLSAVINWPKVSLFFCSVILMGSTLCTSNTAFIHCQWANLILGELSRTQTVKTMYR